MLCYIEIEGGWVMTDYSYIGKRIKVLRNSSNLSQKDLAARIGKAESSIQKYEAGKVQIPVDVLEKIAIVLNTDVFKLMAMNYDDQKETAVEEMKNDVENMLYMVGYEATEIETGEYEIIGKSGSVTVSRNEIDALYISFLDYISYAADKFYKEKREEKFN